MENRKGDAATIFVRGLPFEATNEQLEGIFEDVGPIRECFVIPSKKEGIANKGIGFVQFATPDDAHTAIQHFNGQNHLGRTLHVELAVRGKRDVKDEKQASETQSATKPVKAPATKATKQAAATKAPPAPTVKATSNIVVVTGLSKNVKEAALRGHVPKTVTEIIFPSVESTAKYNAARLVFPTIEATTAALAKLHTDSFFGKKSKFKVVNERITRVIIRNLSFKASANDVQTFCQAFHPVAVELPKGGDGKIKGFAFVQFASLPEATKAIEQLNAKKLHGRAVALDWALNKTDYENRKQREEAKTNASEGKTKTTEKKEQAPAQDEESEQEADDDAEGDLDEEDLGEGDEQEGDEELQEEDDDSSGEEEEEEDAEDDAEQKDTKRTKRVSDTAQGATLFVRNLLFETTQQDVYDAFAAHGKVKYARMVPDKMAPELGRHNGSAFVQFFDANDARKVLELYGEQEEHQEKPSKNNPKRIGQIYATNANEHAMMLQGRALKIVLAVDKQQAAKLKEKPEKKDARNLYLVREGLILPGTPAAADVSEGDLAKRSKAYKAKKENLKNSNYFVSKVHCVCVCVCVQER